MSLDKSSAIHPQLATCQPCLLAARWHTHIPIPIPIHIHVQWRRVSLVSPQWSWKFRRNDGVCDSATRVTQQQVSLETGLILFMGRVLAISRNNHAHKWPVKCWPDLSGQLHFIFHLAGYLQNKRESGANKKLSNRFCRSDNVKVLKYFKMRQT